MKKILTILLVISLTACGNSPKPITDNSERIMLNGFSVLPPNEDGWFLLDKNKDSVTFGKKTKDSSEFTTFAFANLASFSASVKNENEFLDTVKTLREIYINPEEQHIRVHNEQLASEIGKCCVKYLIKTEGKEMREKFGITCRHPKNKKFILDYSVMQKGKENSNALMKTGTKFLPYVQFEEFYK